MMIHLAVDIEWREYLGRYFHEFPAHMEMGLSVEHTSIRWGGSKKRLSGE